MSEFVDIKLKRAAITLADELDYARSAMKMGSTPADLRRQISILEAQLCLHIFKPRQQQVELTEEGQFLIKAFRASVELHDQNVSKGADDTR